MTFDESGVLTGRQFGRSVALSAERLTSGDDSHQTTENSAERVRSSTQIPTWGRACREREDRVNASKQEGRQGSVEETALWVGLVIVGTIAALLTLAVLRHAMSRE